MNAVLEKRVRAIRSRAQVRRWEYRQRDTSHGAWHRVRRFLTLADEAWVVSREDATKLIAEGYVPDPAGFGLEPSKTLLSVPRARLLDVKDRRQIPVSLGPEFLSARCVVAIAFEA